MVAQQLVAPPGAPKARQNNTVPRELPTTPLIEDQALSLVSSNRDDPPERETAAPVGAGNGGLETRHRTANPDNEFYPVSSLEARFPIIALHFGLEVQS